MFAIEITIENMPKIRQSEVLSDKDITSLELYLRSPKVWYLVRGYVPSRGAPVDWVILPAYKFEKDFDYHPIKIKTNWDLIVKHPD